MPVRFRLVQKGNFGDASTPERFYPKPEAWSKSTIKKISKHITDISSLRDGGISSEPNKFVRLIPKKQPNEYILSLSEAGVLRFNFGSEDTPTEEAFTPSKIRNVKIAFHTGEEMHCCYAFQFYRINSEN
jgi:hypothetical protein